MKRATNPRVIVIFNRDFEGAEADPENKAREDIKGIAEVHFQTEDLLIIRFLNIDRVSNWRIGLSISFAIFDEIFGTQVRITRKDLSGNGTKEKTAR